MIFTTNEAFEAIRPRLAGSFDTEAEQTWTSLFSTKSVHGDLLVAWMIGFDLAPSLGSDGHGRKSRRLAAPTTAWSPKPGYMPM